MTGPVRAALVLAACSFLGVLSHVRVPDDAEGFGLYPLGMICLALVQVPHDQRTATAGVAGVATAATMWWVGLSPAASILYGAAGAAAALMAVRAVRPHARAVVMEREIDLVRVIGAAVAGGMMLTAAGALAGVVDGSGQMPALVLSAFVNEVASLVLWLPFVMKRRMPPALAGRPERALQWTLLLVVSGTVLSASGGPSFGYLVLLVLCWAALRLTLLETLLQLLVVRLISTSFVGHDTGPFARAEHHVDLAPDLQWLYVQLFLVSITLAVVALSLSSGRARRETRRAAIAHADAVATSRLNTVFEALEAERTALEEMREVDRVKDSLVSTVSHELRTPITNIIGYQEMLDDGDFGDLTGPQRTALAKVGDNGRRLLVLIDDLLTLSGLRSGQLELKMAPVDLVHVAKAAEQVILPRAENAGVALVCDLPDELVVTGEAEKLERMLVNLMSNAVKFTPARGRVTVRVVPAASWAIVEVHDTGYGIPADDLEKLFSQFFRTEVASKRHIQGTGLGLSIVRSIVEAHGGQIEVSSTVDVGTVFRVYLPR